MEDTLLLFSDYAESMASMKDKESTSISKLDRRRLPSEDDKFKEPSQAHAEFQKVRLEVMGVLKSTKMATELVHGPNLAALPEKVLTEERVGIKSEAMELQQ
tara:strand:- start:70 stop:375 length:306 start_codon:yes stop_codon:yes gene_type:complete